MTTPGVRHLGLDAADGIEITDPELRLRTRLSAFTSRDIRGEIVVGQVQRIQAGSLEPSQLTGLISANITALALDQSFGIGGVTIGYIRAGDGITGNIIAVGDPVGATAGNPATLASIFRIVVGPAATPTPQGIQGDILAKHGQIESVFTTGPIGTPESPVVNIIAGDGITEIRATAESSVTVLDRDFNVNVLANSMMLDPVSGDLLTTFNYRGPEIDGVLSSLETAGDLTGEVRAANIFCTGTITGGQSVPPGGGRDDPQVGCAHAGIYVRGIVRAPIQIDYHVLFANIVARTYMAPVTIGRYIKGSVVAVGNAIPPDPADPLFIDGHIPEITIGHGPLAVLDPGAVFAYESFGRGLCGITAAEPFNPASLDDWFTAGPGDGAALDGVVKAASSIGSADLQSVSLDFLQGCKHIAPRVEAPVIDSLEIDDFRVGSVWSGAVDADPGNDFAEIGSITVGCCGPQSAVWMTDWDAARFGTVFGGIHVPTIPAGKTIFVDRYLADITSPLFASGGTLEDVPCECRLSVRFECGYICPTTTFEESPQDPNYPRCQAHSAPPGRIWSRGPLAGQIIINAANGTAVPANDHWTGSVWVGVDPLDASCPLVTIAPTAAQPDQAPVYQRVSADLGGGAVGLAPFHLYQTDCKPAHDSTPLGDSGAYILESEFNENGGPSSTIECRFYGPIKKANANPWLMHIKVQARPHFPFGLEPGPGFDLCQWVDVSQLFTIVGPGVSGWTTDRAFGLRVKSNKYVGPGIYMAYPVAANSVQCVDVTGNPAVVWPEYCDTAIMGPRKGFVFVIANDCDGDGLRDDTEDPEVNCNANCPIADWNNDGTVTVQDIFDFLGHFFVPCTGNGVPATYCWRSADVNNSGDVTVQDIFDFLNAYFSVSANGGCD